MDWFLGSVYLYVIGATQSLCILLVWADKKNEKLNFFGGLVVCAAWFFTFPVAGFMAAFRK